MEKKISDLDYSEIAAAINGYLNSEASIKQYVLSDLGSEVETIRKNWKGDASDKYIGKLESVYNDISNTCTALENLGVGMSPEASNIYQNQ